ncbi:hypothetical protein [Pseudomonas sp. MWU12-2323]|uniref:hypothetical protein n=1 Tax=Pseudomonas sp. MWU12-2323 TaxID=2651296 RepID=UPI00128C23A3|nr:hypothetical protein [Pseudomonas sp. MWU12-2323]MPQ71523.1 hypothetical protein [Pseudomonas sp. MWU12-2323]
MQQKQVDQIIAMHRKVSDAENWDGSCSQRQAALYAALMAQKFLGYLIALDQIEVLPDEFKQFLPYIEGVIRRGEQVIAELDPLDSTVIDNGAT